MRPRTVTLPELALLAGTRAALGAGIALLLADRLTSEQRRAVGLTLAGIGVITTIPIAAEILFGHDDTEHHEREEIPNAPREQSLPIAGV